MSAPEIVHELLDRLWDAGGGSSVQIQRVWRHGGGGSAFRGQTGNVRLVTPGVRGGDWERWDRPPPETTWARR